MAIENNILPLLTGEGCRFDPHEVCRVIRLECTAALQSTIDRVICAPNHVTDVSEIANLLSLSDKTISTYRARILGKMSMKNNSELTQYAIRSKLVD